MNCNDKNFNIKLLKGINYIETNKTLKEILKDAQ